MCMGPGEQNSIGTSAFAQVMKDGGGLPLMSESVSHQDLHGFAVELRQLAYTMPAGHEDRLIHLAERMAAHSRQHRERGSRGA